jgi:hypothetical protein
MLKKKDEKATDSFAAQYKYTVEKVGEAITFIK